MKFCTTFNHKGGVGKTTITYNLAHSLAERECTTLLVDADPQANLTQLALSEKAYEELLPGPNRTLAQGLGPVTSGAGDFNEVAPVELAERVFLLPGDIRLSEFESILPQAWNECFSGLERGARPTSALRRLATSAAAEVNADYVLFDVGPNVGPLTRAVLLSSDGFLVPAAPDLFSIRALQSLGTTVKTWSRDWSRARDRLDPRFQLDGTPHLVGVIKQHFNIYGGRETQAYERWAARFPQAIENGLLQPLDGILDREGVPLSEPARSANSFVGELKNFHSLIPAAQQYHLPIFGLTGDHVVGAHITKALESGTDFGKVADELLRRLPTREAPATTRNEG